MLKGRRIAAFILSAVLLFSLCGCGGEKAEVKAFVLFEFDGSEPQPADLETGKGTANMEKVCENGRFELYLNKKTLQFAAADSETGTVWYSSPLDDPGYKGEAGDELRDLFRLTVYDGTRDTVYNSYTNGVKNGDFSVSVKGANVEIKIAVGQEKEITSLDLPQAVDPDRFEEKILAQLDDEQREQVLDRYTLFSLDDDSISERRKESALEKYPVLESKALYIINDSVPDYVAEKLKAIFDSIGYGEEEINSDNEENGVDIVVEDPARFELTLTLTLTNSGIDISADCERLTAGEDTVREIELLPCFSAAVDKDANGFILLPDGSGSVVDISGEKSSYPEYSVKLYGEEKTVLKDSTGAATEQAVLPAFGIKTGGGGFAAVITEGDGIVSVESTLFGYTAYSSVYASFETAEVDSVDLGYSNTADASIAEMIQPCTYTGKIEVSYTLLENNEASLYEMSKAVRSCLEFDKLIGQSKKREFSLNIELVGGIDVDSTVLGIFSVSKMLAVTDFDEAAEILDYLKDNGAEKIRIGYSGWYDGGMYSKSVSGAGPLSVLGGKKGLNELSEAVTAAGAELILSADLMSVKNTDGLSLRKYAARALGNTVSELASYDIATQNAWSTRKGTYIAPSMISEYAGKGVEAVNSVSGAKLRIADMGKYLYSEMNTKKANTREDTKQIVTEFLSSLSGYTVDTGNLYTLKNAEYITSLPTDSSRYKREEYAVPFVQMVLGGAVGYCSSYVNMNGNMSENILRAVAFGTDLSFLVSAESPETFSGTYFGELAFSCFDNLKDTITESCSEALKAYEAAEGSEITDYYRVADGVFVTVFENGSEITANYNSEKVAVGGNEIEAYGLLIKEA